MCSFIVYEIYLPPNVQSMYFVVIKDIVKRTFTFCQSIAINGLLQRHLLSENATFALF